MACTGRVMNDKSKSTSTSNLESYPVHSFAGYPSLPMGRFIKFSWINHRGPLSDLNFETGESQGSTHHPSLAGKVSINVQRCTGPGRLKVDSHIQPIKSLDRYIKCRWFSVPRARRVRKEAKSAKLRIITPRSFWVCQFQLKEHVDDF